MHYPEEFMARMRRLGTMAEDILLIFLLAVMILLATTQIFLRNVLDMGLIWADGLVQILVLWLGLLGAMAASREDNHINIDLLTRFLSPKLQLCARMLCAVFTALVCGVIAWHAFRFVAMEQEFGTTVLGKYPAWAFEAIIPLGFGLISYRYTLNFFVYLRRVLTGKVEE
jgi:TRAP-type C4-dicarboxylate transport system permease small subunit